MKCFSKGAGVRNFHCESCDQAIYFENVQCVCCGHQLAYLPDVTSMAALERADDGLWRPLGGSDGRAYRLCRNYAVENACNWAVPQEDEHDLCRSCRLTRTVPDLSLPEHRVAWAALEAAKRRLVYDLLGLGLPLRFDRAGASIEPIFDFLADGAPGAPPVKTGHADGVITINVAEAHDAEREKRRMAMQEPYRTLLGHLRHESGHFYWDQLIRDSNSIDEYRELFGDERADYGAALQRHYQNGPPADWQLRFVSAYATAHSWEDWAETWAHYLHLTDTLDTACECGLVLRSWKKELPKARPQFSLQDAAALPFERVISDWLGVTFLLNNLSRGLGQRDPYPFILSEPAIAKLEFVHRICAGAVTANAPPPAAAADSPAPAVLTA